MEDVGSAADTELRFDGDLLENAVGLSDALEDEADGLFADGIVVLDDGRNGGMEKVEPVVVVGAGPFDVLEAAEGDVKAGRWAAMGLAWSTATWPVIRLWGAARTRDSAAGRGSTEAATSTVDYDYAVVRSHRRRYWDPGEQASGPRDASGRRVHPGTSGRWPV